MPDWKRPASKPRKVVVRGIEGTLANYDVKVTIEKKAREFTACHEPRARSVPMLAGTIEFGIHVMHSGDVGGVDLKNSDVGDRELERCFVDVIRSAHFPKPSGGDADVTYTMLLGPAEQGREPEQWNAGRVQHVVAKHSADVRDECSLSGSEPFTVTAYVDSSGRVVAAGVAGKASVEPERFDCIAKELSHWPMPKPTRKRYAKVTFPLRSSNRGRS